MNLFQKIMQMLPLSEVNFLLCLSFFKPRMKNNLSSQHLERGALHAYFIFFYPALFFIHPSVLALVFLICCLLSCRNVMCLGFVVDREN